MTEQPTVEIGGETMTQAQFDAARRPLIEAMSDATREYRVPMPFTFDENLDLEGRVTEALGYASSCWSNLSGAGTFLSDYAKDAADKLVEYIRDNARCDAHGDLLEGVDRGMLAGFRGIQATSERVRAKLDAEMPSDLPGDPHLRWRQLEDGTWAADRVYGPGSTVVVEKAHPTDRPTITVIGRMQEMNPSAARWLGMRLIEAAAVAEVAVIP